MDRTRRANRGMGIEAKGWMRVMKYDAWLSMVVYTVSTVAFYLLGAAILHRTGMIPASANGYDTLIHVQTGIWRLCTADFSGWRIRCSIFDIFVANAAKARMATDVIAVLGFATWTEQSRIEGCSNLWRAIFHRLV